MGYLAMTISEEIPDSPNKSHPKETIERKSAMLRLVYLAILPGMVLTTCAAWVNADTKQMYSNRPVGYTVPTPYYGTPMAPRFMVPPTTTARIQATPRVVTTDPLTVTSKSVPIETSSAPQVIERTFIVRDAQPEVNVNDELDAFYARMAKIQLEKHQLDDALALVQNIKSETFKVRTIVSLAEYVSRDKNYQSEAEKLYRLALAGLEALDKKQPLRIDAGSVKVVPPQNEQRTIDEQGPATILDPPKPPGNVQLIPDRTAPQPKELDPPADNTGAGKIAPTPIEDPPTQEPAVPPTTGGNSGASLIDDNHQPPSTITGGGRPPLVPTDPPNQSEAIKPNTNAQMPPDITIPPNAGTNGTGRQGAPPPPRGNGIDGGSLVTTPPGTPPTQVEAPPARTQNGNNGSITPNNTPRQSFSPGNSLIGTTLTDPTFKRPDVAIPLDDPEDETKPTIGPKPTESESTQPPPRRPGGRIVIPVED